MRRVNSPFYRIVFSHLRSCRSQLSLGIFALVGTSMMSLLEPWPFKIVIDYVLLGKPLPHGLRVPASTRLP